MLLLPVKFSWLILHFTGRPNLIYHPVHLRDVEQVQDLEKGILADMIVVHVELGMNGSPSGRF